MSALHLKHCVQSFNVFDFLRGIVIKVPDMGGPDASGEDRLIPRRRKAVDDEEIDMDDEFKRSKIHEVGHSSSGRGRGRCRGRGRGRASRAAERESILYEKCEDDPDISLHDGDKLNRHPERVENAIEAKEMKNMFSRDNTAAQKFDLNTVLDENGDSSALKEKENGDSTAAATSIPEQEMKHEYLGWPFSDMDKMAIDPIQLAQLNGRIDDEEDYDEER